MSKNSWAKYYEKNKQIVHKKARDKYENEEEKEKKATYGCDQYKTQSKDEKLMLVEYRKKYKIRKNASL